MLELPCCSSSRLSNGCGHRWGIEQWEKKEVAAAATAWERAGTCNTPSPTTKLHSHGCYQLPLWQTQSFRRTSGAS